MTAHSCEYCRTFVINIPNRFFAGFFLYINTLGNSERLDRWIDISWSLAHAETGRKSGCTLLQLLFTSLQDDIIMSVYNWDDLQLGATCSVTDTQWSLSFKIKTSDGRVVSRLTPQFWLYAEADNPAADFVLTRPIAKHPCTPETYRLAKEWITECIDGHQHSLLPAPNFVPTRLVKIDAKDGIVSNLWLVADLKQGVQYTALSYCWGGEQPQKTVAAQLKDRERSIPFGILPRTLRHAVEVTINLGYEYIWIDSLCIIQDDEEDRSIEIARMPLIYNRAVVTIAAGNASRAKDGFLFLRPESNVDQAFDLNFQVRDGPIGKVTAVTQLSSGYGCDPLHTRGWTLQERILSTRVLEYSSRQLRFICPLAKGHRYVDGWSLYPERNMIDQNDSKFNVQMDSTISWNQIITHYTQRCLGIVSDRPLAISGVANMLEATFPDTYRHYVTGLWRSDMPGCLLWCVVNDGSTDRYRPQGFRQPSWSWTAVDSSIWMYFTTFHSGPYYQTHVEVLSHKVDLQDSSAPYGAVKQAVLCMQGRLESALCKLGAFEDEYGFILTDEEEKVTFGMPILDGPASDLTGDETKWPVHLLESSSHKRQESVSGLVLKPECKDGTIQRFSRLGVFVLGTGYCNDQEITDQQRRTMQLFQGCEHEFFELV